MLVLSYYTQAATPRFFVRLSIMSSSSGHWHGSRAWSASSARSQSGSSAWKGWHADERKRPHEGGWSEQEGAWRRNPEPDAFVIKTSFISPKELGPGVFEALKKDAMENHAITLVKCRGRDSTAGRKKTKKQGTTTHQLTIIGRDCGLVYKLFCKAASDAGLQMPPQLPHIRIPAEFAESKKPQPKSRKTPALGSRCSA